MLLVVWAAACSRAEKATFFRTMVYTREFAERFKLPAGAVETLDVGVHAIAYRVVKDVGSAPYCSLDLYLDDKLELDYPPGEQGIRAYPDAENPLFFDQSVDREWERARANFHTLGCRSTGRCVTQTSSGSAHWRHLVPGVALQSHRIMCTMFDPGETGPTEVWLLRAGVDKKHVVDIMHADGSGVLAVKIPERLLKHAVPHTRKAIAFFSDPPPPDRPVGAFEVPPK